MKRTTIAWVTAVGVALPAGTFAQEEGASAETVEALRREVSQLKIDLESMRVALSELAELDKRRSEVLRRLLNRTAGSTAVAEKTDGRSAPPPPPPKARKAPPPTTSRRSTSSRGGGTVEGRVTVPKGEPVAYVFIENVRGRAVKNRSVTIKQQNKRFAPNWAVIERGTTVEFPNLDAIYHNVFSLSPGNTFDLGLYRAGEGAKSYRFMSPGVVDLYCNIHPRMAASVLILPNRHFAKVQPDGTFRIDGVPTGKRKIVAWAPGAEVASAWANVGSGSASVELALKKRTGTHKNKFGKPYGSYP